MKKLSLFALVAIMLVCLNSCQYKNPALESSENPMVKEFEMCNLLLGKSKTDAEKVINENGYNFTGADDGYYHYAKVVDNKIDQEIILRLGKKSKVFCAAIEFEPKTGDTYLAEFAKMKEVVTTFANSVTISTKEACDFNIFVNSLGAAKLDYNTMLSRIDSSTNGFACLWAADAVTLNADEVVKQAVNAELTGVYFDCGLSDNVISYEVTMMVVSQKYK